MFVHQAQTPTGPSNSLQFSLLSLVLPRGRGDVGAPCLDAGCPGTGAGRRDAVGWALGWSGLWAPGQHAAAWEQLPVEVALSQP